MPGTPPATHSCPRVTVASIATGSCLFAAEPIPAGTVILRMDGELRAQPTRHSLQLDDGVHLESPAHLDEAETRARYPWRYLDHSCDPNAWVRDRELVARRDIPACAPITFDYNTTEMDLAHPFPCHCGAAGCAGTIAGFVHLDGAQQARREAMLLPYLRRRQGRGSARG